MKNGSLTQQTYIAPEVLGALIGAALVVLAGAGVSQLQLLNRQRLTLGKGGLRSHFVQDCSSDFHGDLGFSP